jgi:tellurite resistance protein TerC
VVLSFIGVKMLLIDLYKIPVGVSLTVVASVLTISIIASIIKTRREVKQKVREKAKA